MEALLNILLTWQFLTVCLMAIIFLIARWRFNKAIKNAKFKFILHQLSKGFLGLMSSRKGVMSLLLFAGSQIPMTLLCFLGKIDGTAYGICLSAVTTAVVAVFCHTQSKTDQLLGTPQLPLPFSTIDTIINAGGTTQTMSGPGITANVTPTTPSEPTT